MEHLSAQNGANESSVDIVSAPMNDFPTRRSFYSAATHLLWDGYEGIEKTEAFLESAIEIPRSNDWLVSELKELLQITPIPDFIVPETATDVATMCERWNAKDIVWSINERYFLFSWGTSA